VLVDIGASGAIHGAWKLIAPYAVCIAFDADARDFAAERAHPYRRLHLHNAIVTAEQGDELDFYLTRAPHCSSTLEPRVDRLAAYFFAELFDVEREVRLPARQLSRVLAEHRIDYVDWFKTDSQGTDLRLFLSLGDRVVRKVLTTSFEPGIIDAYAGEDKLHAVLAKMEELPFFVHDLDVRGTKRLARALWDRLRALTGGAAPLLLRDSPGWVEIGYLNTLEPFEAFDLRDTLLAWVIATLHGQHGHALELAERGHARFGDPMLSPMAAYSLERTIGWVDRMLPALAKKGIQAARSWMGR
jgi:hypothetical protein